MWADINVLRGKPEKQKMLVNISIEIIDAYLVVRRERRNNE